VHEAGLLSRYAADFKVSPPSTGSFYRTKILWKKQEIVGNFVYKSSLPRFQSSYVTLQVVVGAEGLENVEQ